jgi:hypothetical protein
MLGGGLRPGRDRRGLSPDDCGGELEVSVKLFSASHLSASLSSRNAHHRYWGWFAIPNIANQKV